MRTSTSAVAEESFAVSRCMDEILGEKSSLVPLSTYRLQFNKAFRFEDARRLAPYLHQLGVSHCYASPILKARAGSVHGYDIIDHNQLNPEIGTEEELRAFVRELKAHGMGLILDTVPNHMGIGPGSNPWWQDVLQNGRSSEYADFFDIDWEPLKEELRNKVLIPILGDTYGDELEKGNINLKFEKGRFVISYFDHLAPIDPRTIPLIFGPLGDFSQREPYRQEPAILELQRVLSELRQLPRNSSADPEMIEERRKRAPLLMRRFEELAGELSVQEIIEQALEQVNGRPEEPSSFDHLHVLLEGQPYRLAFWRVSGEEINYRRFFDVNDLIGLRMEDPRVFAETHRFIRRLLADGLVSGLRIDHPDGLFNPVQYFKRLQMLYVASRCCGPEATSTTGDNGIELEVKEAIADWGETPAPLYLLAEKILEHGEELPAWPVDGTVGYDFANLVNGILIDRRNQRYFTKLYQRVIGGVVDAETVIYQSKKLIMLSGLSSEVNVLTHLLDRISTRDRRARDYTRSVLRNAIREAIASFPVYRTYIDERGNISERDRYYIEQAIAGAKLRNPEIAPAFDFLQNILLLRGSDEDATIYGYRKRLYFTLKFQQLTGPVMAKGLEDTTCYAYNRFVSVNEVGGSPAEFGVSVDEFHRGNELRAQYWPDSLLTTSTHDTKRSEDVRARLDVLSEMPRQWSASVMKWRRINRGRKVQISDGRLVPDNNEEYLLYQTIVGALPMRVADDEGRQEFIQRIQQYTEKAVHEAKVNVSWLNSNPEYIAALNQFIERILRPQPNGKSNLFYESLMRMMPGLKFFGAINSLTQTLLKLTCPGVPDVYQGQELWDFSLVDPDNRRPVDFALRENLLARMREEEASSGRINFLERLFRDYQEGHIKLWLTESMLNFRRERRDVFRKGDYIPLRVRGSKEENLVAFARSYRDEAVVVAAPRLACSLMRGAEQPPIASAWNETTLDLGPSFRGRPMRNVFTGEAVTPSNGTALLCRELFAHFPLAVLSS